jgi:hypothetical protein
MSAGGSVSRSPIRSSASLEPSAPSGAVTGWPLLARSGDSSRSSSSQ